MNENKMTGNRPEKRINAGAVQVSVWKNQIIKDGKTSEYKTVSFDRRYKDKEGEWKSTNSLRISDIPKAVAVLNRVYNYLIIKEESPQIEEERIM